MAEMAAAMLEFIADHVTRRPPSGTAEGVRIARRATALSIEKAQRELGYAPRPVEPALRETIAYLLGGARGMIGQINRRLQRYDGRAICQRNTIRNIY